MTKTLFIAINIIGFLIFNLFQKNDLDIKHDAPASLKPGEEKVVTFDIDKSDVTGFAKFQITLDEGLTAEMVQASGASFTFNNQTVKFIWMAVPASSKIQVKFRLKANENAVGNLEMKPRFSYIYQNERKNYDVPTHIIAVGDAAAFAENASTSPAKSSTENTDVNPAANRTVTPVGVNQWQVTIEIDKAGMQGFAKVEETVPLGYTVIDFKSSDAVFQVDDRHIKYIWYDIPESDVVTVSYKMLPVISSGNEKPEITGNFSFLKDDENVVIPILDRSEAPLAMGKDTLAAEVAGLVEKPEESKKSELPVTTESKLATAQTEKPNVKTPDTPVVPKAPPAEVAQNKVAVPPVKIPTKTTDPVKPTETITNDVTASKKSMSDGNIVDVPQPETGIFYRVQIAAGKNNLNGEVFTKMYNFGEGFKLETGGGLLKYTTGYHQVYKAARDDRERITRKYDKFKGPFVAAYNDGERITVQEALMVTSQKWFQ